MKSLKTMEPLKTGCADEGAAPWSMTVLSWSFANPTLKSVLKPGISICTAIQSF